MAKPLLSIGMIVKNEIRCIERCLKALQPLRDAIPCELVIADTGSDDGTREVAARYADILFDFKWISDFSAARNAVMDRCNGLWHFTVDADEYLDPDISQLVEFLQASHPKKVAFASVVGRNYRSTEMKGGEFTDFITLRLARMSGVRYVGAVHEHWPMQPGQMSEILRQTILHHDGYAKDLGERGKEKYQRNMELLRVELERKPDDLRLLLQCVESSQSLKAEQGDYIHRGMRLIMEHTHEVQKAIVAAFYRYGARFAFENNLPEAERWLAWGEEHLADSIFFRVDVTLPAAIHYLNQKDYARALELGNRYLSGYADLQAGNYNLGETTVSTLGVCLPEHYVQACQLVAKCRIKLGIPSLALEVLERSDPVACGWKLAKNELMLLFDLEQVEDCAEKAENRCAQLMKKVISIEQESGESTNVKLVCMVAVAQMFGEKEKCGWRLYRKVPGDLGLAAQAMDETEPEALAGLLGQISNWKEIPNPVVLHAVEQGAPLPEAFYRKGAESLRNTASALGGRPGLAKALLRWREADDFSASMIRFQFLFELTAAALRGYDYTQEETGLALAEQFVQVAADYLPNYYHPRSAGGPDRLGGPAGPPPLCPGADRGVDGPGKGGRAGVCARPPGSSGGGSGHEAGGGLSAEAPAPASDVTGAGGPGRPGPGHSGPVRPR